MPPGREGGDYSREAPPPGAANHSLRMTSGGNATRPSVYSSKQGRRNGRAGRDLGVAADQQALPSCPRPRC